VTAAELDAGSSGAPSVQVTYPFDSGSRCSPNARATDSKCTN